MSAPNDSVSPGAPAGRVRGPHLEYLLAAYIFGDISEAGRREVEGHLAACEACREELESLRSTVGTVKAAFGPGAPKDLSLRPDRFKRVLDGSRERRSIFRMLWVAGLPAAAVLCTVGLLAMVFMSKQAGRAPGVGIHKVVVEAPHLEEFDSTGNYRVFLTNDSRQKAPRRLAEVASLDDDASVRSESEVAGPAASPETPSTGKPSPGQPASGAAAAPTSAPAKPPQEAPAAVAALEVAANDPTLDRFDVDAPRGEVRSRGARKPLADLEETVTAASTRDGQLVARGDSSSSGEPPRSSEPAAAVEELKAGQATVHSVTEEAPRQLERVVDQAQQMPGIRESPPPAAAPPSVPAQTAPSEPPALATTEAGASGSVRRSVRGGENRAEPALEQEWLEGRSGAGESGREGRVSAAGTGPAGGAVAALGAGEPASLATISGDSVAAPGAASLPAPPKYNPQLKRGMGGLGLGGGAAGAYGERWGKPALVKEGKPAETSGADKSDLDVKSVLAVTGSGQPQAGLGEARASELTASVRAPVAAPGAEVAARSAAPAGGPQSESEDREGLFTWHTSTASPGESAGPGRGTGGDGAQLQATLERDARSASATDSWGFGGASGAGGGARPQARGVYKAGVESPRRFSGGPGGGGGGGNALSKERAVGGAVARGPEVGQPATGQKGNTTFTLGFEGIDAERTNIDVGGLRELAQASPKKPDANAKQIADDAAVAAGDADDVQGFSLAVRHQDVDGDAGGPRDPKVLGGKPDANASGLTSEEAVKRDIEVNTHGLAAGTSGVALDPGAVGVKEADESAPEAVVFYGLESEARVDGGKGVPPAEAGISLGGQAKELEKESIDLKIRADDRSMDLNGYFTYSNGAHVKGEVSELLRQELSNTQYAKEGLEPSHGQVKAARKYRETVLDKLPRAFDSAALAKPGQGEPSVNAAGDLLYDPIVLTPSLGDKPQSGRLFAGRDLRATERRLRAYRHYRALDAQLTLEAFAALELPVPVPSLGDEGLGQDGFRKRYGVHPFVDTQRDHFSTFGMDVDTASYTLARNLIGSGKLPDPKTVRVEEFINYFGEEAPADPDQVFSVFCDGGPSPFGAGLELLKITVKARTLEKDERKDAVLTFAVDTSGSMATAAQSDGTASGASGRSSASSRLALVRDALRALVSALGPDDRVGIVAYASQPYLVLPHTPAREAGRILGAIESLSPRGATNVEAGLDLAYRLADEVFQPKALNRVILCSDGVANAGARGPEEILKKVEVYAKRGIFLSSIGVGMGRYNDALLETLADKGNGNYAYVDTTAEAEKIFRENLPGTLQVLAQDAKIQVDFSPDVVSRYRLLGYENRDIADKDFRNDKVDAGEVGPGSTVTVLYEIQRKANAPGDLGRIYIRYRDTRTTRVEEVNYPLSPGVLATKLEDTGDSFRFTASVAELAELLRQSYWSRDGSYGDVLAVLGSLSIEYRARPQVREVVDLVTRAQLLSLRSLVSR